MKPWKRYLLAFWLLPIALPIWLFYILPFWAMGFYHLVRREGLVVKFFVTRRGLRRLPAWVNWGGNAQPFAIFVRHAGARLGAHETRHTDQWLALGPLFPIVYGLHLFAFGYGNHPLENDARHVTEGHD